MAKSVHGEALVLVLVSTWNIFSAMISFPSGVKLRNKTFSRMPTQFHWQQGKRSFGGEIFR